jgi:hypothetical protein
MTVKAITNIQSQARTIEWELLRITAPQG